MIMFCNKAVQAVHELCFNFLFLARANADLKKRHATEINDTLCVCV